MTFKDTDKTVHVLFDTDKSSPRFGKVRAVARQPQYAVPFERVTVTVVDGEEKYTPVPKAQWPSPITTEVLESDPIVSEFNNHTAGITAAASAPQQNALIDRLVELEVLTAADADELKGAA